MTLTKSFYKVPQGSAWKWGPMDRNTVCAGLDFYSSFNFKEKPHLFMNNLISPPGSKPTW